MVTIYQAYIASCVPEGGLYRCELDSDGNLRIAGRFGMNQPMYAIRAGQKVYVLLRAPFGNDESGVMALDMTADGQLSPLGQIARLGGAVACHLAVSSQGQYLYAANYVSGSLTESPILSDGSVGPLRQVIRHQGRSVHPTRQTSPHTHCTVLTPDGLYLCVVDLGLDQIVIYVLGENGLQPEAASICQLTPGYGPRHLIFAPDGRLAYCANELESSVTVLRYSDGRLMPLQTYPTLPVDFTGVSACAAIRITADGRFLYISNRGHDSIACYRTAGESLALIGIVSCGGENPRDFNLTPDDRWLVCANEKSGNVRAFRVNPLDGSLEMTAGEVKLPAALGVMF